LSTEGGEAAGETENEDGGNEEEIKSKNGGVYLAVEVGGINLSSR
jgi:hypothetical protein